MTRSQHTDLKAVYMRVAENTGDTVGHFFLSTVETFLEQKLTASVPHHDECGAKTGSLSKWRPTTPPRHPGRLYELTKC